MFTPKSGTELILYILGALVFSGIVLFLLTLLPVRFRKPLIALVTFLAGLFFALEFFLPVETEGPAKGQNLLTPYLKPVAAWTTVLQGFALGIGVYSLVSVHLRNIARRRPGRGFSVVLLAAIIGMVVPAIWKEYNPDPRILGWYEIMYDGAFNSLNATMYSVVAFYIVSAAYRAFRIRSREATLILSSAFLIMLGQVTIGQTLTNWIPNEGLSASFRVENIANWILTRINAPAVLAIEFGVGIGALATSLRIWLSLERGSYFDEEL
ncbi:MAG: hypothetical protein OHK0029_23240 [Armatimonadaceae bacterium]